MSVSEPEREDDADDARTSGEWSLSELASRIESVREADELESRIRRLPHAWVLVFDADTDDEAVYSMEIEGEDKSEDHVVLAFEERSDAEAYSRSLYTDAPNEGEAEVQALDLEALIVTSRDADFRVALVFAGDLDTYDSSPADFQDRSPIFSSQSQPPSGIAVSINIVPETLFADKKASDFIDPTEDPVWVLIHDAGTSDAQFFSMQLNGTASVVCFKDEAAADRCSRALVAKGGAEPATQSLLLEDLLDLIVEEMEVCLVDEVVETYDESGDSAESGVGVVASDMTDTVIGSVSQDESVSSPGFRSMLEKLFTAGGDAEDAPAAGATGGEGGEASGGDAEKDAEQSDTESSDEC